MTDTQLGIVVGIVILLGVVLSVVHPGIPIHRRSAASARSVCGVTGTAAGVDGRPLALLYQHREPQTLRATIATCFLIGAGISGTALALGGQLSAEQLELTAILLAPMLVGLAVSGRLARRIPAAALRPIVLGFATVAGGVAIARAIFAG